MRYGYIRPVEIYDDVRAQELKKSKICGNYYHGAARRE